MLAPSSRTPFGPLEGGPFCGGAGMTPRTRDRRVWWGVALAVIVVVLVIGWAAGWFGGAAPPETAPAPAPATTQ